MEEDEVEEIKQAQEEGSTTGWTGTTLAPTTAEASEKGSAGAKGNRMDWKRKRVALCSPPGAEKKRAMLILPRHIESSADTSDQTCCAQAKRVEGLAIVENVASNVFERREWNTKKLREELKRRGLPIYGTKSQKRNRLIAHMQGHRGSGSNMSPECKKMMQKGEEKNMNGNARSPDFTKHEFARLCKVLASPEWTVALQRTVNPAATREELDAGIEDAWSKEIEDTFNNPEFRPEGYRIVEGLEDVDPNLHPFERSGSLLKNRFTSARSDFTTAYLHWSASGQNDPDNFRTFIRGDLKLLYMFLCFRDSPALDFVLRTAPRGAQGEEGIPAQTVSARRNDKERTSSIRSSRWKQRESLTELLKKTPEETRREQEYMDAKTEAYRALSRRQSALRHTEELEKYINMEAKLLDIGDARDNPRLVYVREKIKKLIEQDLENKEQS